MKDLFHEADVYLQQRVDALRRQYGWHIRAYTYAETLEVMAGFAAAMIAEKLKGNDTSSQAGAPDPSEPTP